MDFVELMSKSAVGTRFKSVAWLITLCRTVVLSGFKCRLCSRVCWFLFVSVCLQSLRRLLIVKKFGLRSLWVLEKNLSTTPDVEDFIVELKIRFHGNFPSAALV
jgi:hypothetical protein